MSAIPHDLRAALHDAYLLERIVGRGGMATVYLAHDVKHNRRVAVKVLKTELAASLGAGRFLKEIEIAARLMHPHIVALHDSGNAEGFLYYVMPFIEGRSLRARLSRHHRVPLAEALEITTRVGDALAYAHRQGVVHRDIKPENILFAEGHAMVADFGIARAISTAGGAELTRTGFPVGTPGYMSPEQAAGIRELDVRTDVYSLGCVCYEMLIGETPGMWLTDEAVKLGRFIDASASHRELLDTFSGSVEQALARALALRPDARLPSVEAFLDALAGTSADRRRYGETEIQDIIQHAAEDQALNPTAEESLSIGAVQQIGAQVGISPERIDRAARDLEVPSQASPPAQNPLAAAFLGASTLLRFERTLNGEVPPSEYEYLVDELQSTLGIVGQIGTLGRSLVWSTTPAQQGTGRGVQITIVPRDGQTRIRIEEHLAQVAGGLFGGMLGGGGGGGLGVIFGIGAGALQAPAAAAAVAALWVSGTYVATRKLFRGIIRKRSRQLESLADRLADQATAAIEKKRLGGGGRGALPR